jgi:hypothetical protein
LDTLFSDIDSLQIYVGIHPIYFNQYYCALSKRFPFAIYYRIEQETILVYAVFDYRRDPALIKDRLEGDNTY